MQKEQLQSLMAGCNRILAKAAKRNYGGATPKDVLRLRDEYRRKSALDISAKDIGALDDLRYYEGEIIEMWVRVGLALAGAFHTVYSNLRLEREEWNQVAYDAVWDAMYTYNGSTEFSNYVHWVTKRRMVDKSRQVVVEQKAPVENVENVDAFGSDDVDIGEQEERKLMTMAIQQANLTDYQRAILDAYVQCDGNCAEVARQRPTVEGQKHKKKIGRMAVLKLIQYVRGTVLETYEELRRKAA